MAGEWNGGTMPDLSAMLGKIMDNPQAMAMLSSLLGAQVSKSKVDTIYGEAEENKGSYEEKEEHRQEEVHRTEKENFLPPPCDKHSSSPRENRKHLLLALKPYLSPERRQAVDRILMITEALSFLQSEKRI